MLALVYGVDLLRHLFPVSQLKDQTVNVHGIKLDLSYSSDAQGTDLPVSKMMQVDGQIAPWWPVQPNSSLLDVVKRLAAKVDPPWSSCRRVPVVDPSTGRVVKIISQSEMVAKMVCVCLLLLVYLTPFLVCQRGGKKRGGALVY